MFTLLYDLPIVDTLHTEYVKCFRYVGTLETSLPHMLCLIPLLMTNNLFACTKIEPLAVLRPTERENNLPLC